VRPPEPFQPRRIFLTGLVLVFILAGCQALPQPTPEPPTRVASVLVPVVDPTVIDAAREIFVRRLELLGASRISVTTASNMTFTMRLPSAVPQTTVEQALRSVGRVTAVPPFAGESLVEGAPVPDWFPVIWDSGDAVRSASVINQSAMPAIEIVLTDDGAKALSQYTASHVGEPLALVLDGIVLTTPTIQTPISGDTLVVVLGGHSAIDPTALATILSSGPLPNRWHPGD